MAQTTFATLRTLADEMAAATTNNITTLWDENQLEEHNEDADPELTRTFCIIGLVVVSLPFAAIVAVLVYHILAPRSDLSSVKFFFSSPRKVALLVANAFLLIGCSLGLAYANRLVERDEQDYRGKMRIVGVDYERRYKTWTESERHCRTVTSTSGGSTQSRQECYTTTERYYRHWWEATLTLDWGYDWGCGGDHGAKQCSASKLTYCDATICSSKTCANDIIVSQATRGVVEQCIAFVYNANATYTPYQARLGPSQDVDWPTITAYGDCQTCQVQQTAPSPETLRRFRRAALAFTIAGGAIAIATLLSFVASRSREWNCCTTNTDVDNNNNDNDKPQHIQPHFPFDKNPAPPAKKTPVEKEEETFESARQTEEEIVVMVDDAADIEKA